MRADWLDHPQAHLVVHVKGGEKSVPIFDQLFVGRQCAGIDEQRRLVIPDPNISRNHLEIRLDVSTDRAYLIDTSTNGTLLNGMPLERAVQVPIKPDDQISMGDVVLIFRSDRFNAVGMTNTSPTLTRIVEETMVMVVGDITNYSTISEVTDNRVIARSLNYLWHDLNRVLRAHRGTLNHYAGDALYAVWEVRTIPEANELAIDFALAANRRVEELAPTLPLRGPDRDRRNDKNGHGRDRRRDQRGVPVGRHCRTGRAPGRHGQRRRACCRQDAIRLGPLRAGRDQRPPRNGNRFSGRRTFVADLRRHAHLPPSVRLAAPSVSSVRLAARSPGQCGTNTADDVGRPVARHHSYDEPATTLQHFQSPDVPGVLPAIAAMSPASGRCPQVAVVLDGDLDVLPAHVKVSEDTAEFVAYRNLCLRSLQARLDQDDAQPGLFG